MLSEGVSVCHEGFRAGVRAEQRGKNHESSVSTKDQHGDHMWVGLQVCSECCTSVSLLQAQGKVDADVQQS